MFIEVITEDYSTWVGQNKADNLYHVRCPHCGFGGILVPRDVFGLAFKGPREFNCPQCQGGFSMAYRDPLNAIELLHDTTRIAPMPKYRKGYRTLAQWCGDTLGVGYTRELWARYEDLYGREPRRVGDDFIPAYTWEELYAIL